LTKWIKPKERGAGETTSVLCTKLKKRDADDGLPETLQGIDLASALPRVNGNKRLYRQLLIDFAKKYSSVPAEIRNLIAGDDFAAAERLVHSIKGIAGNISAYGIQTAASELEKGMDSKNTESYDQLLSDLDQALQPVLAAICSLDEVKQAKPLKNGPVDPVVIRPILKELDRLLRKDDPDAEKSLELLKENIGSSMFPEEMRELDKHIGNFDFGQAINSLDRIAQAMNIPWER
jgi:HPt (histidine-containing phosphotransfer) domain-containing protein